MLKPNLATSGTPQGIHDCEAKLLIDDIDYCSHCCDTPSKYEQNRAVDPEKLWAYPYYEDVEWQCADNVGNNKVSTADGQGVFGGDPYGFIMVDGPDHAISHSFATDFTVLRRDERIAVMETKPF